VSDNPECPYVVGTVTRYCTLTPLTLTDAEREAVETAALEADAHQHRERAATLRGLLERLSPPATPQSYCKSDETATHSHTAEKQTAQKMSQNDSF